MAELVAGAYAIISVGSSFAALTANDNGTLLTTETIASKPSLTVDHRFYIIPDKTDSTIIRAYLSTFNKFVDLSTLYDPSLRIALRSFRALVEQQTWMFDNEVYDCYVLYLENDQTKCLTRHNDGTITVSNYDGSVSQRWIFVPMPLFTTGETYRFSFADYNNASKHKLMRSEYRASGEFIRADDYSEEVYDDYNTFMILAKTNGLYNIADSFRYQLGLKEDDPIWQSSTNKGYSISHYPHALSGYTIKLVDFNSISNDIWYPSFVVTYQHSGTQYNLCFFDEFNCFCLLKNSYRPENRAVFTFEPLEHFDNTLSLPEINEKYFFTEANSASFSLPNTLTINSTSENIQYRYRYHKLLADGTFTEYSSWMTGPRLGWPKTNTYSDIITDGETISINIESTTIPKETYIGVFLDVETRCFNADLEDRFWIGSTTSSTIQNILLPTVSVSATTFFFNEDTYDLGFFITITPSYKNAFSLLKVDVYNSLHERVGVSDWSTSSKFTYIFGDNLHTFPDNGEVLTFDVQGVLTYSNVTQAWSIDKTVSYSTNMLDVSILPFKEEGNSITAFVQNDTSMKLNCYYSMFEPNGARMVMSDYSFVYNNQKHFVCYPPLNRDVMIVVVGKKNNQLYFGVGECRVDSHLFVWNWVDDTEEKSASIIINTDAPPEQTRSYANSTSIAEVYGRTYPLAFSNENLHVTLDVKGVVLDDNVLVTNLINPIPANNSIEMLISMISLSHKGIHPIFRNPYGDWYKVVVTAVDVSKEDILYTSVSIKQEAVDE